MFLVMAFTLAAGEPACTTPSTKAPDRYEAANQCVKSKIPLYAKRDGLARDLAIQLALECAELLPQTSDKDCGKNQTICDQIQADANADITEVNAEMAYRMIVTLRQSATKNAPNP
jgi:hypothetical protein